MGEKKNGLDQEHRAAELIRSGGEAKRRVVSDRAAGYAGMVRRTQARIQKGFRGARQKALPRQAPFFLWLRERGRHHVGRSPFHWLPSPSNLWNVRARFVVRG